MNEPSLESPQGSKPVAIVTGASGAIGSATATRLVRAAWRVGLVARDRDRVAAGRGRAGA